MQGVQIVDLWETRFRIDSIKAGIRLSFFVFGAGVTYAAGTWEQPHRLMIAALFALLAIWGLLAGRLPAQRIVHGRHREAFFLGWGVFWIAVTAALVAVDGGAGSPLTLLFFLPLVFAALSYPLASMVAIAVLSEAALVVAGSLGGAPDPVRLSFFAAALAATAMLCAWQAHTHDLRRDELTAISRADPLTGSLNRRGFEERIGAELDRCVRTGRPLAVVMLDLDHFKHVNDTRGHAAGDALLCWAVEKIQTVVRPMDSVGRLGGDEFALLLPGIGQVDAVDVAERVRDALSERVGASTGVAAFPAHGIDQDELLRHADSELYAAREGRLSAASPTRRELSWAAAIARAVDLRMASGDEHSGRVAEYAGGVAQLLGWQGPDLALLRMAAMLHDVGKVSLPDNILRKPGPLDPQEFEMVKEHPVTGAELVARVDGLEPILPWIRHSHEHFDGSGYPDGLSGEEIPEASRVLLVADAFDALTSDRPYRPGVGPHEALEELERCAGQQFDPRCVSALKQHLTASIAA